MIIYRTKYYGLLGDRVRQAIKESGRESSDFMKYLRDHRPERKTTPRTLNNLEKQWYAEHEGFDKFRDENYDLPKEIEERMVKRRDELKNKEKQYIKQNRELNKLNKDYFEEDAGLILKEANEDLKRVGKNRALSAFGSEDEVKKYLKFEERMHKMNLRKNPNDKKLMNDIKEDFIKNGGKAENFHNDVNDFDSSSISVKDKEISPKFAEWLGIPKEDSIHVGNNPGIASHEVNHYKNKVNNRDIDDTDDVLLNTPRKFWGKYDYVTKEESGANKRGFRDIFLNKHSGGRDWRSTAHANHVSNRNYHLFLGQDINKVGMQDLDYGMSPEALRKLKENAKKLGIDLDKSAKVQYTKATPEERKAIEKYVKENEDKF